MRQKSLAGAGTIRISRVKEHPKHHLSRGVVQRDAVSTHIRLRSSASACFIFAFEGVLSQRPLLVQSAIMIFYAKILFVGLITIATTWERLADARMERERWLITRGQIESVQP